MALRTIVQDGDPILKKKCRPVTNYDARLAQLLDDMRDTLEAVSYTHLKQAKTRRGSNRTMKRHADMGDG